LTVFLEERQCLFHSLEWSNVAQSWCSTHMKRLRGWQYSFKKLTQFSVGNIVVDPPVSNIDALLTREKVLVPLTWMELFAQRCFSSDMKILSGRQYSFQYVTEFSWGNNGQDISAFNTDCIAHKIHVFLHLVWSGYFSKIEWFSHFITLSDRKYSLNSISQFAQLNHVLEPSASNIDRFLSRNTVLLPFSRIQLFCTKMMLLTFENPEQ
jgi:hypothetical protein